MTYGPVAAQNRARAEKQAPAAPPVPQPSAVGGRERPAGAISGATANLPASAPAQVAEKGRTIMMHGPVAAQNLARAEKQAPASPSVPPPGAAASREAPAGALRAKPDEPVTPIVVWMSPADSSDSAGPPFGRASDVAPAAKLDEGNTQVDPAPVDLPPAAVVPTLRQPPAGAAGLPGRGGMALRRLPWLARAWADAATALSLLAEATVLYRRTWRPLLLLVAILLLPAAAAKSCMVAAVTGSAIPDPLRDLSDSTVDFSRVKQELTRRAQASRAAGKTDKAALAEIAALETVAAASTAAVETPSPVAVAARWLAAVLVTGLLLFGLAVPLAYAILTVAMVDQRAGAPLPSFMDVGVLLWRRRLRLVTALLPAAAIVALGSVLFVGPGLVAAVLLLFVPVVVLFERAAGKAALLRSVALVRADAVRVIVVALAATLLSAAAFMLADLVMPGSSRRILVFLRVFLGDLLMIASLPVPALAMACLYVELRGREGVDAAALAQAARR
jgi:hypothetical protein